MTLSDIQALLDTAAQRRVLCVGDLMVDRFVYGEVNRISPEAPIPVMSRRDESVMLGGVGNVARNLAALGVGVGLAGVVGDDACADVAARLIAEERLIEGWLVVEHGRRTTEKVRYVAGGQQLLRVDAEDAGALSADTGQRLASSLADAAKGVGAILISDYAKGAITPALMQACRAAAQAAGAAVVVDPKGPSLAPYGAVDLIKPNGKELALVTGLPTGTDAEVEAALAKALNECEARAIVVTRAGQGMSIGVRGEAVRHVRAAARQVFDVSGAGDTALAALGASLAAGASLDQAVALAILASGVVVGKAGTAVVTPQDLMEAEIAAHLAPAEAKIAVLDHAVETVAAWRRAGLKVGFTNGCFDILHRGHVSYLAGARAACDRLVVGLNTDASVKRLKGEARPVNDLESRALVLAGLASVDLVTPFAEDTPLHLIETLRPDLLMKGADYTEAGVVGAAQVRSWGGDVRLIPLVDGYSTTAAISRMSARDAAR